MGILRATHHFPFTTDFIDLACCVAGGFLYCMTIRMVRNGITH